MRLKEIAKNALIGTIAGAIVVASAPVIAEGIEAVMNSVNISLNGEKAASSGESYTLQNGTSVPYSILYEGTTYLPIRKVSELLNIGIDWDNDTRTVIIDDSFDSWRGVPDFGEFYEIPEIDATTTVRSTTHWYEVGNVKDEEAYVARLEELGFERITEGSVKPKFKAYKKGTTEVWLDLGMYKHLVYGVTVVDTTRPASGRTYEYTGRYEDIPDFADVFGFTPSYNDGRYYFEGDWKLWSCLPDYFTLLEQEGFSISSVKSDYFGKFFVLKKGKSSLTVKFNLTDYSNIPAVTVEYN